MEDKVIDVMRIKLEDLPQIQRGYTINAQRCVVLSR